MNKLFYGDNLHVLRKEIAPKSVDLIYLDPPFNSNSNYNVLFKAHSGKAAQAQIEAFEDTWHWNENAESAFADVQMSGNADAFNLLRSMRSALGENDMMAYLAMMAIRLIELHKVLKDTGSIYLHCDPTASHYLKILMDSIFGSEFFRNEIIWKRTTTHSDSKTWSRNTDSILFYTKSNSFTWNTPREAYSDEYVSSKYRFDDGDGRGLYRLDNMTSPNPRPNMMYVWKGFPFPQKGWRYQTETMEKLDREGRVWYPTNKDGSYDFSRRPQLKRYLSEMSGGVMGNIWTDITPINSQAQERLGYPTQKPVALLERILSASSNEGDLVLDPFCGCGTTIHAAQKIGRNWIGIDITHLAISLIERRLSDAFPGIKVFVEGTPKDFESAEDLAKRDPYQFQWWALSLIGAVPFGGKKKGADGGIDGFYYCTPDGKSSQAGIVSVKSGNNLSPRWVTDLSGVMSRENSPIGILLLLRDPTQAMTKDAASAGFLETPFGRFPKIQIITVKELLEGKSLRLPPQKIGEAGFSKAAKESSVQNKLL